MGQLSKDFKFRSGKYKGVKFGKVQEENPNYIKWIKENHPEMLEERKPKKEKPSDVEVPEPKWKPLTPNLDFDNEPPDEGSLIYMRKHPEKFKDILEKYDKTE